MLAMEILICAALCGDGENNASSWVAKGAMEVVNGGDGVVVLQSDGGKCTCKGCGQHQASKQARVTRLATKSGAADGKVQVVLRGADGEHRILALPKGQGAFRFDGTELKPLDGQWQDVKGGKLKMWRSPESKKPAAAFKLDLGKRLRDLKLEPKLDFKVLRGDQDLKLNLPRSFKIETLQDGDNVIKLSPGQHKVKVKRVPKSGSVLI